MLVSGGDGGNRTRVRKIQPANIYERSRLIFVARRLTTNKDDARPTAGTRKPLFRTVSGVMCGTPTFSRPAPPPVGGRGGRTWP